MVWKNQTITGEFIWEKAKSHSEKITSVFSEVMKQDQTNLNDIDAIACVVGPGSFTGIRVGVNFCKSLAYANQIPMVSINSLDLLALNGEGQGLTIAACLDAQKNSLFLSLYDKSMQPEMQNMVVPVQRLHEVIKNEVLVCGSGVASYSDFIDPSILNLCHRENEGLPADLKTLFKSDSPIDLDHETTWENLKPIYIKASAPEEKLNPSEL